MPPLSRPMRRSDPRPAALPKPRWVWLCPLLALVACGGDELAEAEDEEPRQPTAETRAADPPAEPVEATTEPGPDAPTTETRALPAQMLPVPEWADELRARIDSEGDDSWREKLAVRFESAGASLFAALLRRDGEAVRPHLAPNFEGLAGFEVLLRNPRFDDGAFQIFDPVPEVLEPEGLESLLEKSTGAPWSRAQQLDVRVSVVAITPGTGQGRWSAEVELRAVAELDGTPTLLDMEARLELEEGELPSDPPRLVSGVFDNRRLIRRRSATFAPISGYVLKEIPLWNRELAYGANDFLGKSDRRHVGSGTGMLGMALGDVNGDGRDDLYISQPGGLPNRLLLNQPDGSMVDAAATAGVNLLDTTRGCLLVDLDGDDDLDLCVARGKDVLLFWNDGTGKFGEQSLLKGPGQAPIYSLCAADPDLDGDLDLYASRYLTGQGRDYIPTPYHDATNGAANQYWRNDGERRFTEAGAETGLTAGAPRYSFVSLWEDFDEDGRLDLYVVNDFGPNNLYMNTGEGFVDAAAERGMLDQAAGMGISVADVELDGDLDLFVTNMDSAPGLRATAEPGYRPEDPLVRGLHRRMAEGNSLLLNVAPGQYEEGAIDAGVEHGGWAWGAIFHDWNLDGLPDVYVPNGFISGQRETDVESLFWRWVVRITPPPEELTDAYVRNWAALSTFNQLEGFSYNGFERNHVYLNIGDGEFADVSPISDVDFLDDGRVAARTDWDGDGREDLLLVNRSGPRLRLLRNVHPNPGHRVVLELHGRLGSIDAVGARVRVERSDGKVVTRTVYAGEGLLGQSSRRLFFGLGAANGAVDVEVRWPDGEQQRFEGLRVDRGYKLYREAGRREAWDFARSRFEGKRPAPVRAPIKPVPRVVLAAKVPLSALQLRDAEGPVYLDELPEKPKLLVLHHPASGTGEGFLRALAPVQSSFSERGGLLVPVAFEDEGDPPAPQASELGLAGLSLVARRREQLVLATLVMEVLGNHEAVDLPITLLLDSGNNLCALYFGEVPGRMLLNDLRRAAALDVDSITTAPLLRGYWVVQPRRAFGQTVTALQMIGARDLAKELEEFPDQDRPKKNKGAGGGH